MKKVFLVIFVLFTWTLSADGSDLKIGYVDLNKVLNMSDEGEKATKILEEMVSSKQPAVLEKEAEVNKLKEELKKQVSILTPESRKEKEDRLNKLIRDAQIMVRDFQDEIQKKESELRIEILKDLREVVNKIGEEDGYAFIFEEGASGILYSQKKFNLTEKVIKKYNASAKTKE